MFLVKDTININHCDGWPLHNHFLASSKGRFTTTAMLFLLRRKLYVYYSFIPSARTKRGAPSSRISVIVARSPTAPSQVILRLLLPDYPQPTSLPASCVEAPVSRWPPPLTHHNSRGYSRMRRGTSQKWHS